MHKRKINFKSVILKVFFTYLVVYFLALIFKYNYNLESLLNNIQYNYLITLNMISVFLGLPFSMVFDFMLIKRFGLYYVLFFSPVLTIISFFQVLILRKIDLKFYKNILIFKKEILGHASGELLTNFISKDLISSVYISLLGVTS